MPFLFIGALVNSALYFAMVFVAALLAHKTMPEYLAIAGAGATYLSYVVQSYAPRSANLVVGLSVIIGAAAGFSLILT